LVVILLAGSYASTIEAEFSEFSGLTTMVKIGSPKQELRVSLDFQSSENSYLFVGAACPPFVSSSCYRPRKSDTFTKISCETGNDVVDSREIEFAIVSNVESQSLAMREVAGKLSLPELVGDDSIIGIESVINVEDSETVLISPFTTPEAIPKNITWIDFDSCFEELKIVSFSFQNVKVKFNPGRSDIVLPSSFRDVFLSATESFEIKHDRLFVSSDNPISFGLISQYVDVRIPVQQLRLTDASVKTSRLRTVITFADQPEVVIGRQILSLFEKVFFDFASGRIGLSNPRSRIPALRSPKSFIPFFGQPELVNAENGGTAIRMGRQTSGGLALLSAIPSRLVEGRNGFFFEFVKLNPDDVEVPERMLSYRPLSTLGRRFRMHADGRIELRLQPNPPFSLSYRISTAEDNRAVKIIFEEPPLPKINELDLPIPMDRLQLTPTACDEPECPICIEKILAGELIQSLGECAHLFHRDCIQIWLEKGHLTCPMCRGTVQYKQIRK
jgi:hypothetical protein